MEKESKEQNTIFSYTIHIQECRGNISEIWKIKRLCVGYILMEKVLMSLVRQTGYGSTGLISVFDQIIS